MKNTIEQFAALLEAEQIQGLHRRQVACQSNIDNAKVKVKFGQKYIKVDVGNSGKFMVEAATGNIFGIKGYGVIHRGHWFGTLDTINEYDWSQYSPSRKDGTLKTQKANGYPVITYAPAVVATN